MAEQVQECVCQAQRGDAEAFARLIERYERSALAVAYALLHDADRAADAVQEGFFRAWQELKRLQDPARFGGWLLQIVRNAAIDLGRRRKRTTAEFPDLAAATPDPAVRTQEEERDEQIRAALAELDETTRMAVTLRYYDGLSAKEIAEALDVSPASIDMRLSRGRGILREKLADLVEPALIPPQRKIGERS